MLITEVNHRELWCVPPSDHHVPVEPVRLHTFDQPTVGIVEVEPDVSLVCSTNLYTTHEAYLHRFDFKNWLPGASIEPHLAFEFPKAARGPDGICLFAPEVILAADCFAGLIWRIDLQGEPRDRIWLKHSSMGYDPAS